MESGKFESWSFEIKASIIQSVFSSLDALLLGNQAAHFHRTIPQAFRC